MADGDNPGGSDPTGSDPAAPPSAETGKEQQEQIKRLVQTNAERAKELQLQLKSLKAQKDAAKASGETLKQAFLANEEARVQLKYSEELLAARTEEIALRQKAGESVDELIKKDEKRYETLRKSLQVQREAIRAAEAVGAHTRNMVKTLTGVGDQWKETLLGGFVVALRGGNLHGHMGKFTDAIKSVIDPMNLFGSVAMKVVQSTIMMVREQDEAIASFRKATSTLGEHEQKIRNIERSNVALAISTGDAATAFASLLTNVTTFAHADEKLQEDLAMTAAQMEKLGVSTQLTAKTMEEAMLVLGMTETAAMSLTQDLAGMATKMSLPIEQVTENFNAAMPVLAKFGTDAPAIFKKVQVASRSLGVEVGQLLQTMGQFDTFEGAAGAAGKLNTILGGDLLNSTELLMADEAERLRMVRESIALSGRQFENMNRFEKLAVANAIGVQDISTATKMLSGNMDRFGDALGASGLTEEETATRIRATQTITEKLANTFRMFAMFTEPITNILHGLMDMFYNINKSLHGGLAKTLLLVSGVIGIAFTMWVRNTAKEAKKFIGELKEIPGHMAKMAVSSAAAAASLDKLGDSMKGATGATPGATSPADSLNATAGATDSMADAAKGTSSSVQKLATTIGGLVATLAVFSEAYDQVGNIMDYVGNKFGSTAKMWLSIGGVITTIAAGIGIAAKLGGIAALIALGPPGWAILAGLGGATAAFGMSALNSGTADDATTTKSPGRAVGGTVQARHSYLVGEGGTGARPEIFTPGNSGRIKRNEDFRRIPVVEGAGSSAAPAAAQADRDLVVNLFLDGKKLAEGTVKHINKNSRYNLKTAINWV